jgi:predicted nucleic acid-binding protein
VIHSNGDVSSERYLVDTTVLIDLSRGIPGIRGWLDGLSASDAELGVCAVNIAEFSSGVPSSELPYWDRLLSEFEYWDISHDDAVRAGAYRYDLARRGLSLPLPDALVAAVAATRDATILTANVRHFLLVSDIRVQSPQV